MQAHAEIRILGDVERIPAADFEQRRAAQMVAGATERNGQTKRRERRQHQAKQRAIFNGEQPREQIFRAVEIGERRLQASHFRPADLKLRDGAAQLIGRGRVLGIEDDDILAARFAERVVAGLWLGARGGGGRDHDFHHGWRRELTQGFDRRRVRRFANEFDLELLARIVERPQAREQLHQHGLALAVERHEDRVVWQRVLREGGGAGGEGFFLGLGSTQAAQAHLQQLGFHQQRGGIERVHRDQYALPGGARRGVAEGGEHGDEQQKAAHLVRQQHAIRREVTKPSPQREACRAATRNRPTGTEIVRQLARGGEGKAHRGAVMRAGEIL